MNLPRLVFTTGMLLGTSALGVARADLFAVQGSTSGTFYENGQVKSWSHLSFTGSSFGPTSGDTITLGTLQLHNGTVNPYDGTFDLQVTFTAPPGVTGSPLVADLTGSVSGNSGSVTLDFGSPILFTFPGGSFDLTAGNVTAQLGTNGGAVTITGTLSNEVAGTPEPISILLLLTCVMAIGFTQRHVFHGVTRSETK